MFLIIFELVCRIFDIEGFYVFGKFDMIVVVFVLKELNIYKVNEVMVEKGWSFNVLYKLSR